MKNSAFHLQYSHAKLVISHGECHEPSHPQVGGDTEGEEQFLSLSIVATNFGTIHNDIERFVRASGLLAPLKRLAEMLDIGDVWELCPKLRSLSLTVEIPLNGDKVTSEQEIVLVMFGRSIPASIKLDRSSLSQLSVGKERRLSSFTVEDLEDRVGGLFKIRSLLESLHAEFMKRVKDPGFWCDTVAFLMKNHHVRGWCYC